MNASRTLVSFFFAVTTFALAGCPESTTPTDGANGSDATSDIGTDASGSVARACMAYSDYLQRCGETNCFLTQFVTHDRPELLSYFETCLPSMMCDRDGGTSSMGPCSPSTFSSSLSPSAAQHSAAEALCAACPSVGGDTVTTASACTSAIFDPPSDGGSSNGVGIFLRYVDDATAAAIERDCVATAQTDGGLGCSGNVLFCMLGEIGYASVFNACNDAGVQDASAE